MTSIISKRAVAYALAAAITTAGCRAGQRAELPAGELGPTPDGPPGPAVVESAGSQGAATGDTDKGLLESLPKLADGTIVLGLPLCLKLAFERNTGLESDRLSDVSTQLGVLSSRAAFLPTISASGSHSDNGSDTRSGALSISQDTPWGTGLSASFSESWDHGSRSATTSVGIDQPLLAGAGRAAARNSLSQSEIGSRISRADLELSAQSLQYSVTLSYYSAARQLKLVEVSRRAVERSRIFLDRTKTFLEAGRKTVLDVSNSQIQLAEREISLARSERNLEDALDNLKDVLDLDPDLEVTVEPVEIELDEYDTDDAKQTIEIERPDPETQKGGAVRLRRIDKKAPGGADGKVSTIFETVELDYGQLLTEALQARLEVANARWRLQQAQLSLGYRVNQARPDLDLSFDYTLSNSGPGFSDAWGFSSQDDSWVVGLTYSFPWGKVSDRVSLEQAKLTVRQREIDLSEAITDIKLEIREQLRLLRTTEQNIFAFAMKIKGAVRALEAAQILVEHGKADNFMIIEAEDDLLSAQTGFIEVLLDYRTQTARLRQRLGIRSGVVSTGLIDGGVLPGGVVRLRRGGYLEPGPEPSEPVEGGE